MLEIREKSLLNIKVVLLLNSHKHSKKGLKMDPEWTGPYVIHEVLSKGTFHLCDPAKSSQVMPQIYNISRLKLYYP